MTKPTDSAFLACDEQGFLLDYQQWTQSWACDQALQMNIDLVAEHFVVLDLLREQYQNYHLIPPIRLLLRLLNQKEQAEAACWDSLKLQRLFPNGVAKQSALLAGLPKPKGCV